MTDTTSLDALLEPRSDLADLYRAMVERVWNDHLVDPVVLELCRVRVAQLLGDCEGAAARTPAAVAAGLDEALVSHLAGWPADSRLGPAERAALTVAEQFVLDVHGVTDDDFIRLGEHFTPAECVGFAVALGIFDGASRLRIALGAR